MGPLLFMAVLMSLSQLFPQITAQFRSRRHPGRHLVMAEIRRTSWGNGSFIPLFIGLYTSKVVQELSHQEYEWCFFSMFPSKNWMGLESQRSIKCNRAIRYSGFFRVRSVGPVGDFLEFFGYDWVVFCGGWGGKRVLWLYLYYIMFNIEITLNNFYESSICLERGSCLMSWESREFENPESIKNFGNHVSISPVA